MSDQDPFLQPEGEVKRLLGRIALLEKEKRSFLAEKITLQNQLTAARATTPAVKPAPKTTVKESVSKAAASAEPTSSSIELEQLQEELKKAKKQRDAAFKERDDIRSILDGIAVEVTEREQCYRTMCAQLMKEVIQLRGTAGAPAAAPVAQASLPPSQPATVLPPGSVVLTEGEIANIARQSANSVIEEVAQLLHRLQGAVPTAAPPIDVQPAGSAQSDAHRIAPRPPSTVKSVHHQSASEVTTSAGIVYGVTATSAPARRGRPPKSIGEERPPKVPRTEKKVSPKAEVPLANDNELLALKDKIRTTASARESQAPSASGNVVHFGEDPIEDFLALERTLPTMNRKLGTEMLYKQLRLHFHGNVQSIAKSIMSNITRKGNEWLSSECGAANNTVCYNEIRKRVELFVELEPSIPREWVCEAVAILRDVRSKACHQSLEHRRNVLSVVAMSVGILCRWLHSKRGIAFAPRVSQVSASPFVQAAQLQLEGSIGEVHGMPLAAPLFVLYEVLVSFLKKADVVEADPIDEEGPDCSSADRRRHTLAHVVAIGIALFARPPTQSERTFNAPTDEAMQPDGASGRGGLLWLTMHYIFATLTQRNNIPIESFYELCDSVGWSRSTLPRNEIVTWNLKSSSMLSAQLLGSNSSATAVIDRSPILCLRILVGAENLEVIWQKRKAAGEVEGPALALLLGLVMPDIGVRLDDTKEEAMIVAFVEFCAAYLKSSSAEGGAATLEQVYAAIALRQLCGTTDEHDCVSAARREGIVQCRKWLSDQLAAAKRKPQMHLTSSLKTPVGLALCSNGEEHL